MREFLTIYGTIYGFCTLGVLLSVLLPILKKALPKPEATTAGVEGIFPRLLRVAKPYLVTGLYSLGVAILLVAFLHETLGDWRAALLAGYAGDSTLQKLRG